MGFVLVVIMHNIHVFLLGFSWQEVLSVLENQAVRPEWSMLVSA